MCGGRAVSPAPPPCIKELQGQATTELWRAIPQAGARPSLARPGLARVSLLAGPENLRRPPKSLSSPGCAICTRRCVTWSTGSGTGRGVGRRAAGDGLKVAEGGAACRLGQDCCGGKGRWASHRPARVAPCPARRATVPPGECPRCAGRTVYVAQVGSTSPLCVGKRRAIRVGPATGERPGRAPKRADAWRRPERGRLRRAPSVRQTQR
jgi:hypothetical protein